MKTWRLETASKTSTTNGKDRGPKCRKARSRAEAMERSKVVRAKPAGTDAWAEISWETQGRKGTSALTGFSSLSCRKGDSGFRDDASECALAKGYRYARRVRGTETRLSISPASGGRERDTCSAPSAPARPAKSGWQKCDRQVANGTYRAVTPNAV